MSEFKVGDRVRLRDEVTQGNLHELAIGYAADEIRSGGAGVVVGIPAFAGQVDVTFPAVGMSLLYDANWLEVVND